VTLENVLDIPEPLPRGAKIAIGLKKNRQHSEFTNSIFITGRPASILARLGWQRAGPRYNHQAGRKMRPASEIEFVNSECWRF